MKKIISLFGAALLLAGSVSTSVALANKNESYSPTFATYTNGDAETYYNSISDSLRDNDLLGSLRSLNNRKRQKTIGYNSLGSYYKYTDYDVNTIQYDDEHQPYSNNYVAFYSGEVKSGMSGMNKEHVWPDSRGGNLVEKDIHMPRPTLSSDNSSRGNSFYVEDANSTTSGWDPKFANPSDITYRGDSARIIFYSVIASDQLSLIDETNDNKNNKTMGKLADLIKWHLQYPVLQREINRNEGAEYLQGNRNPFIDHPEYVCRVWGNTNDATKALCANDPYEQKAPESLTLNKSTADIKVYETLQLSVASVSPEDATKNVAWSSGDSSIATISESGLVTGKGVGSTTITATSVMDANVKATCVVNVAEPEPIALTGASVSPASISLFAGETQQITVSITPSFVYPLATISYESNNTSVATVSSDGLVTAVAEGETSIKILVIQGDVVIEKNVPISVSKKLVPEYELITSTSTLANDDKVVLAIDLDGKGVTGCSTDKADASNNKEEWVNYVVKNASSNGFNLYDETAAQYIAEPSSSSNTFKYEDVGGLLTVDETGRLIGNGKYLAANNAYNRFYRIGSNYPAFHVYRVNAGSDVPPVDEGIHVTSVTLNESEIELDIEGTAELTATVLPENATNKAVTWSSSNESIATIENGLVTAIAAGSAAITVTTVDGAKTATCEVTVLEGEVPPIEPEVIEVTSVSLDKSSSELTIGNTLQLTATINPENATNKNVRWSTDNQFIATVSETGLVTAVSVGTVHITVTTEDGEKTATCEITIKRKDDSGGESGGESPKVSCGGNVVATSVILSSISLVGIVLLLIKKYKEK